MIRRPPRSTLSSSSAASDVYKRQGINAEYGELSMVVMSNKDMPPPVSLEELRLSSEVEGLKAEVRRCQAEMNKYQKQLLGYDALQKRVKQLQQENEQLHGLVEQKERKLGSISRLAWGAQVATEQLGKPEDERIEHMTAEIEKLCLELGDKDWELNQLKLKATLKNLDSVAAFSGSTPPSVLFKTRRESSRKANGTGIGMPGEEETAPAGSESDSAWQALYLRKHREIECTRKVWMDSVEDLGGFVEHLYNEGHRSLPYDEFIMMLKAVAGQGLDPDERPEQKELLDQFETALEFVNKMGRAPSVRNAQGFDEVLQQKETEQEEAIRQAIEDYVEQQKAEALAAEEANKAPGAKEAAQIWASMAVLDFGIKVRISPLHLRKVGAIIKNMQQYKEVDFGDDQINHVVRALFVDQGEEELQKAFDVFDTDGSGALDADEFRKALGLLGEDLEEEELDTLFKKADSNKNGEIELDEFSLLFKDMSARLNTEFAAKEDLWTSMSVLDFAVKVRISPLHLRKVGSIIRNMQDSNITFTDDQINDVIRALFVEDSDENLEAAFKVFDEDGSGYLDTKEFSDTLKILGKDLPQHDIDELFETVDMDGNGTIDLDEFHQMMKQLGLRLNAVSYTHLRAHETPEHLVCRLLLEKKKKKKTKNKKNINITCRKIHTRA
eukprot:TRINITY_DN920_c0_g1_i13.p1 TRINITY_DN920_c0_g1~~TRINITY_DN920_c0_g1_i13.p1  ORF type:complete len:669 (+),score=242.11 TRINITY_DN920_c0_g1_i13:95-2101(+)